MIGAIGHAGDVHLPHAIGAGCITRFRASGRHRSKNNGAKNRNYGKNYDYLCDAKAG
jgi:hypothetical protein